MSIAGPSNISILTHQNKVWSAKRKQKREQVKEIVFDETARRCDQSECNISRLSDLPPVIEITSRAFISESWLGKKRARRRLWNAKSTSVQRQDERSVAFFFSAPRLYRRISLIFEETQSSCRAGHEECNRGRTSVWRGGFRFVEHFWRPPFKPFPIVFAFSGDESDHHTLLANGKAKADPEEMEFSNEEQLATVTIVEDFDPVDPTSTSHPGAQFNSDEDQQSRSKTRRPVRPVQDKTIVKAHKPPKPKFTYETKAARTYEKKKQAARRGEKAIFAKGRRIGKKNEKRQ